MNQIIKQIYNGLLRFTPLNRYFKFKSNHKGTFPEVGFLSFERQTALEKALGIKINQAEYFEQALIHRSYLQVLSANEFYSNERLEFLVDAVLGMIVADYLFSSHLDLLEGKLTKMRSWLVSKKSLVLAAKKLELDTFLMVSYSASKSIENGCDSILADALEAIIAAIYLDSGIETARKFVIDSIIPILNKNSVMVDRNYKSILLEFVQAQGKISPRYSVVEEHGPDHDKEFQVGVYLNDELLGIGIGKSKKQAEQLAAQKALQNLMVLNNNQN